MQSKNSTSARFQIIELLHYCINEINVVNIVKRLFEFLKVPCDKSKLPAFISAA